MTALSPDEKVAGRRFRDDVQAELLLTFDNDPPTFTVPHFLALFRHPCPKRRDVSTALELKEVYVRSPRYGDIPEGRFGFIYRAGKCRWCGQTARSRDGRIVDGWDRPPIHGRVARS